MCVFGESNCSWFNIISEDIFETMQKEIGWQASGHSDALPLPRSLNRNSIKSVTLKSLLPQVFQYHVEIPADAELELLV